MKTVTCRHIQEELRDRINEIAEQHQVRTDDVARAMLEFALAAFDAGELQFMPSPENWQIYTVPRKIELFFCDFVPLAALQAAVFQEGPGAI